MSVFQLSKYPYIALKWFHAAGETNDDNFDFRSFFSNFLYNETVHNERKFTQFKESILFNKSYKNQLRMTLNATDKLLNFKRFFRIY